MMFANNISEAAQSEIEDFTRFEFKYVLDSDTAAAIEQEIRHFMEVDGHVSAEHDERYLVRSLYFDTPNCVNFYEKIDGIKARRKYRLRTYSTRPSAEVPIFLEEKNRIDNRVFKYRTPMTLADLQTIESNAGPSALLFEHLDNQILQRFAARVLTAQERPVVLVGYLRRAFVSNFDIDFRVTFDSRLSTIPARSLFDAAGTSMRSCLAGYTVLEVKFKRRVPSWFHRIVQSHQLRRVSVSKYCEGMIASGLAVDLS